MGHVVGGWEYVWAAYGLTWFGVVAFAVSLYSRRSKEQS
jgi:heme exporter protein D